MDSFVDLEPVCLSLTRGWPTGAPHAYPLTSVHPNCWLQRRNLPSRPGRVAAVVTASTAACTAPNWRRALTADAKNITDLDPKSAATPSVIRPPVCRPASSSACSVYQPPHAELAVSIVIQTPMLNFSSVTMLMRGFNMN